MEIQEQTITFKQVREGYLIERDDYRICGPLTNVMTVNTILSNPYLNDENKVMYILERIDGVVRGRAMLFPSNMIVDGVIVSSTAGSGLFVEESARKYELGLSLMMYGIQHKENQYLLYAGLSKMVVPIYRKLKFTLFSTPLMWQPRSSKFIFQRLGLTKPLVVSFSFLANIFLKPYIGFVKTICSNRRYTVEQLLTVPLWVDEITLKDGHKYAEFHDHRWMQWVVDNTFSDDPRSSRRFYAVYSKDHTPEAFFMIKENHDSLPERHIDDICFGAIVEWGIKTGAVLDEYTLTKMAIRYFSQDVDIVEFTSSNADVIAKMKKFGFVQHGEAHIGFKDLTKKLDKDSQIIDNWRIRLGYSDVAFY